MKIKGIPKFGINKKIVCPIHLNILKIVDENRIPAAVFLIRAGCDLDSSRRPGPSGTGGDEARDLATPLHLCCQWGIDQVVETLLEHGAAINSKVLFREVFGGG